MLVTLSITAEPDMKRLLCLLMCVFTLTLFNVAQASDRGSLESTVSTFKISVENKTIANDLYKFFSPTVKVYVKNRQVKAPYDNNWFYSFEKIVNSIHGDNQVWSLSYSAGKDKPTVFQWVNVASLSKEEQALWADVKDMNASYAKAGSLPAKPPQILNTMVHLCVSSTSAKSCDVLKIDEEVAALFEFKGGHWLITHITGSPNANVQTNFATKIKLSSLFF